VLKNGFRGPIRALGARLGSDGQVMPLAVSRFQLMNFAFIGIEVIRPVGKPPAVRETHRALFPFRNTHSTSALWFIFNNMDAKPDLVGYSGKPSRHQPPMSFALGFDTHDPLDARKVKWLQRSLTTPSG